MSAKLTVERNPLDAQLAGQTTVRNFRPNWLVPVPLSRSTEEQLVRWRATRRAVGAAVRARRQEAGLTQEALAIDSGVTRNMLIHIEHGTRGVSFERIYDLARSLGTEPSALMPDPDWD